jgi:hypothetical protein
METKTSDSGSVSMKWKRETQQRVTAEETVPKWRDQLNKGVTQCLSVSCITFRLSRRKAN